MQHYKRLTQTCAAVVLLVLAMAGCGPDSSQADDADSPTVTVTVTNEANDPNESDAATAGAELTDAEDPSPSEQPTPRDDADDPARGPGLPPPEEVVDRSEEQTPGFTTPSGNIACQFLPADAETAHSVRCDMESNDWELSDPTCELSSGQSVGLESIGEPQLLCVGDTVIGQPGETDGSNTLGYGARVDFGMLRCYSQETGLTCWSTVTGDGFTISQASYDPFLPAGG